MTKNVHLFFFLFLCVFGHANFSIAAASESHDFSNSNAGPAVHDADYAHLKFFVIKPVGKGVIKRAYRKNTYSLRAEVAHAINRAMFDGYDVVLIFSALNSQGFQAAALVSDRIDAPLGVKRAVVQLQWVGDYSFLPFKSVDVEKLNNNFRIIEAKDGQQIDSKAGFTITGLLAAHSCSACIQQNLIEYKALRIQESELSYSAFFDGIGKAQGIESHDCSACRGDFECLMSGKGGIQYFPCEDLLCRSCIEAINKELPQSLHMIHCPLCRLKASMQPATRNHVRGPFQKLRERSF